MLSMVKVTISMVMFKSYLKSPEGNSIKIWILIIIIITVIIMMMIIIRVILYDIIFWIVLVSLSHYYKTKRYQYYY